MNSINVAADGILELDGTPLPNVMVTAAAGAGGKAKLDSQQREGATGADHVFDGWEDWELRLALEISEPREGGSERYAALAALRQAQRRLDGELPAAYLLTGRLPQALGVSNVIITALEDVDDDSGRDAIWVTLVLLETDPIDNTVQQQAAARAAAPPPAAPYAADAAEVISPAAPAAPETGLSADELAVLDGVDEAAARGEIE